MRKLNKDSSVALYQQLVNEIEEQIRTGELKSGDRLMTEVELSKAYDISRITVRKAIEILVEDDILIKKQGIGTFVAEKKLKRNASNFMGFTQMCINDGKVPMTKLLSADLTVAGPSDQKKLNLKEGDKMIRIRRLRYTNGIPVVLEENHLSHKYAFLFADDLEESLYETLAKHGVFVNGGIRTISICYATEEEAQLLGVEKKEALLLMKDIGVSTDGDTVHVCKSIINPKYYSIVINTLPGSIGTE